MNAQTLFTFYATVAFLAGSIGTVAAIVGVLSLYYQVRVDGGRIECIRRK